jgi:uncharacterized protein (DUF2147 family)
MLSRKLSTLIALVAFAELLGNGRAAESSGAIGLWQNEDAIFEIFETDGKLSAKVVSLHEPKTPEGKEKTDYRNPDPAKRNRPIVGLVFMSGFRSTRPGRWEHGTIYDPKTGNTYSCFMELQGPNQMKVRGFIGVSLIGRTQIWTRAQ